MRISDWSSDVCSSDLLGPAGAVKRQARRQHPFRPAPHDLFGELDRLDEIMRRIEMEQRHEPAIDAQRGHLITALDLADQFDRFEREGVGQPRDPALRAEHHPFDRSEEHTSELQSLKRNPTADSSYNNKIPNYTI